jgi:hypothetical protein
MLIKPLHRLFWILILPAIACGDSSTEPTTGSLTVTVSSTGDDVDADGYTLTVNADVRTVDVNGSVTFTDLGAGAQSVAIGGVADNCVSEPVSTQSVTLVAGGTATAAFSVVCDAIPEEMTLVAGDRDGNIYIVGEDTGLETYSFTPEADDGAGGVTPVGVISSMVHVPSTDAWWFGLGGNSICARGAGCVYSLDRDTNSPTVGNAIFLGLPGVDAVSGLAVDPATGKIYTFGSDTGSRLYELDPVTADTTIILSGLNEGSSGKGTTFSDGLLYVAGGDKLTEIDIGAGTDTLVGTLTFSGFTFAESSQTIGSMATRPSDGTVFAIVKDGGGQNSVVTTYLATIDVSTAVVTKVGANTNFLDGLAYVPTAWLN